MEKEFCCVVMPNFVTMSICFPWVSGTVGDLGLETSRPVSRSFVISRVSMPSLP